jgi:diamine N-acetyltransferase
MPMITLVRKQPSADGAIITPIFQQKEHRMTVKLRPLEREDLHFVHQLDNNASVMRYWFEEPYEAFVELSDLYDKHIHDQTERRFVVEHDGQKAGLVELVEINHVHRRAEFQIIIDPGHQGKGLASQAAKLAMDYGFSVLNLYKLYLIVDQENEKAIHIYTKLGFEVEGVLKHEFFINGEYRNTIRMCIFQQQYLAQHKSGHAMVKPTAQ